MDLPKLDREFVVHKLNQFIEREAGVSSPVYEAIARRMLEHEDILELLSYSPPKQPLPHLFLAICQLLSQRAIRSTSDYELLTRLSKERRKEIIRELSARIVQTNEIRRSSYFMLGFVRVCREFPNRPFALIEIGTSAGFNLLFDKIRFETNSCTFGDADSPLIIPVDVRGMVPSYEMPTNPIVSRTGVDLNPIDVFNESEIDWLRALIWPEHHDRFDRLEEAVALRRQHEVQMVKGDGIALLPSLIDQVSRDTVPMVFHAHVANQLSKEARQRLKDVIDQIGQTRDLVHLHNTLDDYVHATLYRGGERNDIDLADVDGHARWIEWMDAS